MTGMKSTNIKHKSKSNIAENKVNNFVEDNASDIYNKYKFIVKDD